MPTQIDNQSGKYVFQFYFAQLLIILLVVKGIFFTYSGFNLKSKYQGKLRFGVVSYVKLMTLLILNLTQGIK